MSGRRLSKWRKGSCSTAMQIVAGERRMCCRWRWSGRKEIGVGECLCFCDTSLFVPAN